MIPVSYHTTPTAVYYFVLDNIYARNPFIRQHTGIDHRNNTQYIINFVRMLSYIRYGMISYVGRNQDRQWEKVTPPHAVAPAANIRTTPTAAAATPVLTFLQYIVRLKLRDARSKRKACWFSWSVLSTNNW